jgi:hypothetical protein
MTKYYKQSGFIVDNEFAIGDTVYLRNDTTQQPLAVIGIVIHPYHITYKVSAGAFEASAYGFELSLEPNVELKTTG